MKYNRRCISLPSELNPKSIHGGRLKELYSNRFRVFMEVIKDIDLEVYLKILREYNRIGQRKSSNFSIYWTIDGTFTWDNTKEGFDYWNNISENYQSEIDEYISIRTGISVGKFFDMLDGDGEVHVEEDYPESEEEEEEW